MEKLNTNADEHSGETREGVETWVKMAGVGAAYNTVETMNDLSAPLQDVVRRTTPLSLAYVDDNGTSVLIRHARFLTRCISSLLTIGILYGMIQVFSLASSQLLVLFTTEGSRIIDIFLNISLPVNQQRERAEVTAEMAKWPEEMANGVMLALSWFPCVVLPIHLLYYSQSGLGDVILGLQIMNKDYQPAGAMKMVTRYFVSLLLMCTVVGGIADFFYFMTSTVGGSLTDAIVGTHVVVHSGSRREPKPVFQQLGNQVWLVSEQVGDFFAMTFLFFIWWGVAGFLIGGYAVHLPYALLLLTASHGLRMGFAIRMSE
jgi:hypothetical protein